MNIGYARLLTIMGNLKKGTADIRDQKTAYRVLVSLSQRVKRINKELDVMIADPYVKKVRKTG